MKYTLALFISMALATGMAVAGEDTIAEAAAAENLQAVDDGAFTETWVNMDVDFHQYQHLQLGSAVFDYRDVGEARPYRSLSRQSSRKTVFGISEEDRREFEAMVGEAFATEISKGKHFTVTEESGPGTILVRGGVVDIISRVPPPTVGQTDVYLRSVGEATLALELLDSQSGEVLAVVAERGIIGQNRGGMNEFSNPSTRGTVRQAVKMWAAEAGRTLRIELDEALTE